MAKTEREIARFPVRSDAGKGYIIVQRQEFTSVASHDGRGGEVGGFIRSFTSDGEPVSYIDAQTFKINRTGEIVRKI